MTILDRLNEFAVRASLQVEWSNDYEAILRDNINCITVTIDDNMSDDQIADLVEF